MKTKTLFLVGLLLFSGLVRAQNQLAALMPMPNHIQLAKNAGAFKFNTQTIIVADTLKLGFATRLLRQNISNRLGLHLKTSPSSKQSNNTIRLVLDATLQGKEHYVLQVNQKEILIKGASAAAILYGVITLDQLMEGDALATSQKALTAITVDDEPISSFRALMLDPARNFLPIEGVKRYIDQMYKYKYNVLQLHLSDDQGWRVEIKSHPKLTELGAFRRKGAGAQGPHNGFYTQAELKDLVKYAADRNVQLVPEIDVPGHTVALMVAYPQLRCDIAKDEQFDMEKTTNKMLSAAKPEVYQVLDDVIRELADIFPSKTIHLGGDESAIESNWAKSPENLALMQQLGYTQAAELMNYFFGKVLSSTRKYGLKAILWCELDNIRMPASRYLFDYPKDVTLVTWRYGLTPKCMELTKASGHQLILAPGEYAYFDYPQYKNDFPEFNNWGMPTTTLEQTYKFDPTYGQKPADIKQVIGVMGTLWGEAIPDINRANYMTWPRALALAEAAWTRMEQRNWASFKDRLYPNIMAIMKAGTAVRAPFELAP